jgi:predicted N-acetyltransferase YhbS
MPDLLVALYKLPLVDTTFPDFRAKGIVIRRANPWELTPTRAFIARHFAQTWADEAAVGFANKPVSVFLAIENQEIIGFAAYECTRRNYFGPTGVAESHRNRGIGRALLLASLQGLKDLGYAYCIIGGAGPVEFYREACGAVEVADSVPGIYADLLKKPPGDPSA